MTEKEGTASRRAGRRDSAGRLDKARALMDSIAACEWEDAEVVLSAVLDEARVGSPGTGFGPIEDEAAFWAQLATFHELRAYFFACGKRLLGHQIGRRGKLRMAQALFADMSEEDRQAVVAGVTPGDGPQHVIQPARWTAERSCR